LNYNVVQSGGIDNQVNGYPHFYSNLQAYRNRHFWLKQAETHLYHSSHDEPVHGTCHSNQIWSLLQKNWLFWHVIFPALQRHAEIPANDIIFCYLGTPLPVQAIRSLQVFSVELLLPVELHLPIELQLAIAVQFAIAVQLSIAVQLMQHGFFDSMSTENSF